MSGAIQHVWAAVLVLFCLMGKSFGATPCVQIYYDAPEATYRYGRLHAIFLQNILGHFPELQQKVSPIEKYEQGAIDQCATNFYIGTYYDNDIPDALLADLEKTKSTFVWMGYNSWQLGETLKNRWGLKFLSLSKIDAENFDEEGYPGFYRFHDYKGETFIKWANYSKHKVLQAAWEISLYKAVDEETQTIVTTRHSTNGSVMPYATRHKSQGGDFWMIADLPFAYMHEDDRHMIFSDLLFDMVKQKPARGPQAKKPAFVRFEDIHSEVPRVLTNAMVKAFTNQKIPFAISLIPVFADPFGVVEKNPALQYVEMTQEKEFISFLKSAQEAGGTIVWHGVTHQDETRKNPFNGLSGSDFEFWDIPHNAPLAHESAQWVVNRLEKGFDLITQSGFKPEAWLTPHYQASPLAYHIFGQIFLWNIGRVVYFPVQTKQKNILPNLLTFDLSGSEWHGKRLPYFSDLEVSFPKGMFPSGQIFPYEIHGDYYGQRLVPENLGNVQPAMNEQVHQTRSVDQIIASMKRNRVLRDTWASFFVHPVLVDSVANGGLGEYMGDTRPIEKLIMAAKEYGYEFIDLKTWTRKNIKKKTPKAIEVFP